MLAMVSTKDISISAAVKRIKAFKNSQSASMIRDISTNVTQNIEGLQSAPRIGVLDLGISASIIKQLKRLGCGIVLIPYDTSAEDILRLKINGMIISNGPENDAAMPDIVKTIKSVIGKLPMMGISTGHELIALATGAKLKKMKIGHRGVNYPVKRHGSDKGEITVQNHSYVVDDKSLKNKKLIRVTARNINDGSVEEMESASLKFISTQYYPASPGFDEVNPVFFRFLRMIPASARLKIPSGRSCEVKHAKA
jgi:carbamoyl-phosphate synthase small subunit